MSEKAYLSLLPSPGPAPDRADGMSTYGRLVGKWRTEIVYMPRGDRPERHATGEWEFGYALEGRAIIDVWQAPSREEAQRTGATAECGLCVRIYEPGLDLWRFTFHGPVHQATIDMLAQAVGPDIVQEYCDSGAMVQWVFSDIAHDSFAWRAQRSTDGGSTWIVEQAVTATRLRS